MSTDSGEAQWAVGGGESEQRGAIIYALSEGEWNPIYSDDGYTLYAIGQLHNGEVVAGGANGRILTNAGNIWHDVGNIGGGKYSAIRAIEVSTSASHAWLGMSGEIGAVLVRLEEGEWQIVHGMTATRVSIADSGHAWAVVGGKVYVRHDGAWELDFELAGGGVVLDVAAVGANEAWAVGSASPIGQATPALYRFNGTAWVKEGFATPSQGVRVSLHRVVFSSPSTGWLMGSRYTAALRKLEMVFYQYEGAEWMLRGEVEVKDSLVDLAVAEDGSSIWATGPGLLVRRDEAGWVQDQLPSGGRNSRAVAIEDPENGWIAAGGSVFRMNDGRWSTVDIGGPTEDPPSWSAVGIDKIGNVWLAGSRGYVARFEGTAWSIERARNLRNSGSSRPWAANDIAVFTGNQGQEVLVAGDSSTIIRGSTPQFEQSPEVYIPFVGRLAGADF